MSYIRFPIMGIGVITVASFANLPVSALNGQLFETLDTNNIYAYHTGTGYVLVAGPSAALSLGALDAQPATAQGAALVSGVLSMQSADATHPGLINTTTQTFAGNKTFSGSISASNLSGTNTGDVTLGTASGLSLIGQQLSLALSSGSTTGALSSTDWNTFNNKQDSLTFGDLTDNAGVDGITITNGTGAVIGTGTDISQDQSSATLNGYLSAADWSMFNAKFDLPSFVDGSVIYAESGTLVEDNANFFYNTAGSLLTVTNLKVQGLPAGVVHSDAFGEITSSPVDLATEVTGVLPVANGGTGQSSYTDGQLLIGNTVGNTLTKATLTAGSGVSITNGNGSISISATGSGGSVTNVTAGTGLNVGAGPGGSITTTGTLNLADTAVTPGSYTRSSITVDQQGRLTAASSGGAINLTSDVTGVLPVANGGTGQSSYTDGQLLIGNTTGNTLAKTTLTAGTGISITNGSGTITVNANGVLAVNTFTTTDTLTDAHDIVLLDASGGAFTFTLSNPTTARKKPYRLIMIGSGTNKVTLGGFNLMGASRKMCSQYEEVELYPDGTNWQVTSHLNTLPPVSYTPTFTGYGTPSAVAFTYQRMAGGVVIIGTFTSGTSTANAATLTTPTGMTITNGSYVYGESYRDAAATSSFYSLFAAASATTLTFSKNLINAANSPLVAANGNDIASAGNVFTLKTDLIPMTDFW